MITALIIICNVLVILSLLISLITLKAVITRLDELKENHRVLSPTRPIMHQEIFDAIRERKLP